MNWYYIVAITLIVYWVIGMIWATIDEDSVIYWSTGLIYPLLLIIFYPIRAYNTYKKSSIYYQKRGISCMQYIFGKRVKHED